MPASPTYPIASTDSDPNCIPQRYSPCPQQLIDMQVHAVRGDIGSKGAILLVFFITVVVWALFFFGFLWWMKKDMEQIREAIEEARSLNNGRNDGKSNGDRNGEKHEGS
jgi:hypothetical protein